MSDALEVVVYALLAVCAAIGGLDLHLIGSGRFSGLSGKTHIGQLLALEFLAKLTCY